MNLSIVTNYLFQRIHQTLKSLGYRRRGTHFIKTIGDSLLMIQLQKSASTTRNHLIFTFNVGVFSTIIAKKQGRILDRPGIPDYHWSHRIGHLMPMNNDLWWEAKDGEDLNRISEEVIFTLREYALPALDKVSTTSQLIALWKSNQSPGLTEFQRMNYLKLTEEPTQA